MEKKATAIASWVWRRTRGVLGPLTASQSQNEEVNSRAASQVLSVGKREEFACDLLKLAG